MKLLSSALRPRLAISYGGSDLAAVALTAAVVSSWVAAANGAFSLLALLACEAMFFAFYLVGSLCAGFRALAADLPFDLPLRLLLGYAAVNTTLLALAWLSPLGIISNFVILFVIASALFLAARPKNAPSPGGRVQLLAVALSLAAATLWCQDSIRPIAIDDTSVVFKPWIDGFYHAVHIRIFGASHGAATIEDFRLAGVPARLYHYGVYLTPALVKQASGISAYTAFAGLLAPLGVFFTGLGAYTLIATFWGAWPGLAGCAALLLLPDGAQQGMGNTFMSYHWLTQISPSATYGLALLAVVWLFVLRGCSTGNWKLVLTGWGLTAVLALYKLHFVIASALLLLLIPPFFFGGALGVVKRALWGGTAVAAYVVALVLVQKVPGVPPIRFDGSSVGQVLRLVWGFTPRGSLRDMLAERIGTESPALSNLAYGAPFVLFASLGVWVLLLLVLAFKMRKRLQRLPLLFPFLVVVNFLVMFFGLALDMTSSTPDELSHRPIMIMYFLVVVWVGGAAGLWLLEQRRLAGFARPIMVVFSFVLLAVPAHFGAGVQRMWAMPRFSSVRVPRGLVRAAEYMRKNGDENDIFQDSQLDRTYTVAAISERRAYASHTMTLMPYHGELVNERAAMVEQFMTLRDSAEISAAAIKLGIRWFLLKPDSHVDWPAEIANRPAFEADGFRVYRL